MKSGLLRSQVSAISVSLVVAIGSPCTLLADNLCGPRAIARILAHYGERDCLPEVLDEMPSDVVDNGVNAAEVIGVLERRGLKVHAVRGGISSSDLRHPVICLACGERSAPRGHYFVLERCKGGYSTWDGFPGARQRFEATAPPDRVYLMIEPTGSGLSLPLVGSSLGVALGLLGMSVVRQFLAPKKG